MNVYACSTVKMPGAWVLHRTGSASLGQAYLGGSRSNKYHWKDVREPGGGGDTGRSGAPRPAAALQQPRRHGEDPRGAGCPPGQKAPLQPRRPGPRAGLLHSASARLLGIGAHTPSRRTSPVPGAPRPRQSRAHFPGESSQAPRNPDPAGGEEEKGHSPPRSPDCLGI